jgi:uncharacterized membrane protein
MSGFLTVLLVGIGLFWLMSLSSRLRRLEEQLKGKEVTLEQETKPVEAPAVSHAEPVTAKEQKKTETRDLEARLGGKIFTAVGVIAVLFGAAFFLRFAFENNFITPPMRVALGVVVGIVCLGLGEWLRRKFAAYGQTLMGLGLGLWYLTSYASLHLYHLTGPSVAFASMIVVTIIGLVLATRLDSEPLAVFSLLGGLLTPILIGGNGDPIILFLYLLLLDAAVLAASVLKGWHSITIVGIVGTAIVFLIWRGTGNGTNWEPSAGFLLTAFLIFATANIARFVRKQTTAEGDRFDLAATAINPVVYAALTYWVVPSTLQTTLGAWYAVIGLGYAAVSLMVQDPDRRSRRYRSILGVIGAAFLAIAAPTAFDGLGVIVAWSVLSTAFTFWGYVMEDRVVRVLAGQAVGIIATFGALAKIVNDVGMHTWLDRPYLTMLFAAACCAISAAIHWHYRNRAASANDPWVPKNGVAEIQHEYRMTMTIDLLKAYGLACVALGVQLSNMGQGVWIVSILGLLALVGGWASLTVRSTGLRVAAYITLLLIGFRMMMLYSKWMPDTILLLNERVLSTLVFMCAAGVLSLLVKQADAQAVQEDERRMMPSALFVGIHATGLWLVSSELMGWFNAQIYGMKVYAGSRTAWAAAKNAYLSVAWTVYALALLLWGIFRKSTIARQCALLLFAVTILKAFLYDTAALSNYYRFVSLMTLGILLLVTGYLYNRFKERIRKFVKE